MNPQKTWERLLAAYAQGDYSAIEDHATALLRWLDDEGPPPAVVAASTTCSSSDSSCVSGSSERSSSASGCVRRSSRFEAVEDVWVSVEARASARRCSRQNFQPRHL